ncbi:SixA phosphatase family protein, partial [Bifidobacterium merycicum]
MASRMSKTAKKAKQYDHVLILMRHAKAEVTGKNGDYDRPLAEKGLKQAKKVAKGLREMKLVPEVIDCSAALRARQTCGRLLKVFGDKTQVDYHQSLYDGGLQAVFDELAHAKDKTRVMMVLGHEPTIS